MAMVSSIDSGHRVWFTADLHLGHGNIIKYCQRPFLTAEERERAESDLRGGWRVSRDTINAHDAALLDAINETVRCDDTLWILGDFCWGGRDSAERYRRRICCRNVNLVRGNHDHSSVEAVFGVVIDQGMIFVNDQRIWLNHYPMRSWNGSFHGAWHLYGHVHGRLSAEDAANPWMLTRDVGVDACGYRPVSFDEIAAYMAPRIQRFKERKAVFTQGVGAVT